MRAPLRLDLRKRDLLRAGWYVVATRRKQPAILEVERRWRALGGCGRPVVTLSARSALDLYLRARSFDPGQEVCISAITHPDMPRILRAHGLVPVPVDLDPKTLAPTMSALYRAVTSKTRALLLTHLLGGRIPTTAFASFCEARGIELWEDCAQCFPDVRERESRCTVSFYSFGPLKTATCLMGGLASVQNLQVAQTMFTLQQQYPYSGRFEVALRTGKYAAMTALSAHPAAYGAVFLAAKQLGANPRQLMRGATKSFGHSTSVSCFRRQPSTATLWLLAHRLRPGTGHAQERAATAEQLIGLFGSGCAVGHTPGSKHWLLVLRSSNPTGLQQALVSAGFDAWVGISNLEVVSAPTGRSECEPTSARRALAEAVMIPLHPDYGVQEMHHIAHVVGVLRGPSGTTSESTRCAK